MATPKAPLQVWQIDGEDLIVARSERDMRAVYRDYHGESSRGRCCRLIAPDEQLKLTDGSEERWEQSANDFASQCQRGYFPAYR